MSKYHLELIADMIALIMLFFSGAVAFGGLMGDKTGNLIGISETLIVSSVSGDMVNHHYL